VIIPSRNHEYGQYIPRDGWTVSDFREKGLHSRNADPTTPVPLIYKFINQWTGRPFFNDKVGMPYLRRGCRNTDEGVVTWSTVSDAGVGGSGLHSEGTLGVLGGLWLKPHQEQMGGSNSLNLQRSEKHPRSYPQVDMHALNIHIPQISPVWKSPLFCCWTLLPSPSPGFCVSISQMHCCEVPRKGKHQGSDRSCFFPSNSWL